MNKKEININPPHPNQAKILKEAKRFNHVQCGRRFGKALDPELDIYTYNRGWIKFGEIQVADIVISGEGNPCNVEFVTPLHENEYYELEFSTGEKIKACKDHKWVTHSKKERKVGDRHKWQPPSVKTTEEIANSLTYGNKKLEYNHLIYCVSPVDNFKRILNIDPYILGLWLGDGSTGKPEITIGDEDKEQMIYEIEARGYSLRKVSGINYSFSDGVSHRSKEYGFTYLMRKIGVFNNKHIPKRYLEAGIEDRLELLRGLNDSDGTASRQSNSVEFTSTNKKLADGYFELVCSLGFKAKYAVGDATLNGKHISKKYRITYSTDLKVFNLNRKQDRLKRKATNQSKARSIVNARYIGKMNGLCIGVDSPNKTFCITKSFIVTHNSAAIKYASLPCLQTYKREHPTEEPNYALGLFFPTYKDLEPIWTQFKDLFHPVIRKKNEALKSMTLINGSLIEFWSMEDPNSGRGRKYHRVIIDEAAKAPKLEEAWEYTIRPTLADYKGDCFFMSTPKGRKNYFFKLKTKHMDEEDWVFHKFRTSDNPFIDPDEIEAARKMLDPIAFAQEFMADDVDKNENPFLWAFEDEKHVGKCQIDPDLPLYLSFDFNVDPLSCIIAQRNGKGLNIVKEIRLADSGIEAMTDRIRAMFGKWVMTHTIICTGDASGLNRMAIGRSTTNYWQIIRQQLMLKNHQIKLPKRNMAHADSRVLCNAVLNNVDIQIDPSCRETINDCRFSVTNEEGRLMKSEMDGNHFLDCFRYLLHWQYPDIISKWKRYHNESISTRSWSIIKSAS